MGVAAILGPRTLKIRVEAQKPGKSQLFFSPDNGQAYGEKYSSQQHIVAGENLLSYPMPTSQPNFRWDPTDASPNQMKLGRWWLHLGWLPLPLPLQQPLGAEQVAEVRMVEKQLQISIAANANDPKLFFKIQSQRMIFLFVNLSCGLLLAMAYFIIQCVQIYFSHLRRLRNDMIAWAHQDVAFWRFWPGFFAIAVGAHFISLATFGVSIDDEFGATRTAHEVWIGQGRWTIYWLEKTLIDQPTVPYFPNILFCLSVPTAFIFVLRAHRIKPSATTLLSFPLFCAFPTWLFLAEFYANIAAAGFGLLITCLAAALVPTSRHSWRKEGSSIAISAILLSVAIGAYQSFLFLFIALALGRLLTSLLLKDSQEALSRISGHLTSATLCTVIGLALYFIVLQVHQTVIPQSSEYISGFMRPKELINHPGYILGLSCLSAWQTYTGSAFLYGRDWTCLALIPALSLGTLVKRISRNSDFKLSVVWLFLWIGIVLVPFSMYPLSGGRMDLRILVGVPYVVWFLATLAMAQCSGASRTLSIVAVGLVSFQCLYLGSLYGATMHLAQSHDQRLADAIYQRLASTHRLFDLNQTYQVDFFGTKSPDLGSYPKAFSSTMGASFFDWDDGNPYRMIAFMRFVGYSNLTVLNPGLRGTFIADYSDMPAWPAAGSVRWRGSVALVKLSNRAGTPHRELVQAAIAAGKM